MHETVFRSKIHVDLALKIENDANKSKRTPNPPLLVTAAASSGPADWFIPARMIGYLMPNKSVTPVLIVSPPMVCELLLAEPTCQ